MEIIADIETGLANLKNYYPNIKSGKIYMGVGNFRTPGTTVDTTVLFGAEMIFGDETTDVSELPEQLQYFKDYLQDNPINDIDFLAAHEFVHTQQVEAIGTGLLAAVLREGSAEFIAELTSGKSSPNRSIKFGKENTAAVFQLFQPQMFNQERSYWLWTSLENPLGERDLGYYVGYELSRHHYAQAANKSQAIADLIELDYTRLDSVKQFIDRSGYFKQSLAELKKAYAANRPFVTEVKQEGNQFTIHFSEPMDTRFRGFDYGPLGEEHVLRISEFIGFAEDGTSLSFIAELTPEKKQQMMLPNKFLNQAGVEMKAYSIEIGE